MARRRRRGPVRRPRRRLGGRVVGFAEQSGLVERPAEQVAVRPVRDRVQDQIRQVAGHLGHDEVAVGHDDREQVGQAQVPGRSFSRTQTAWSSRGR